MRIRSFHIDAFGTLRDVTVEGLPEAGAVFLGHNEAGKSTLLDFFRSTLVGYPRTRDARERGYLVGQSGLLGGSLTLFSDACDGDIRLIRRPNVAKGEPLLTDAEGRPLDPALGSVCSAASPARCMPACTGSACRNCSLSPL